MFIKHLQPDEKHEGTLIAEITKITNIDVCYIFTELIIYHAVYSLVLHFHLHLRLADFFLVASGGIGFVCFVVRQTLEVDGLRWLAAGCKNNINNHLFIY